MWHLGYGGALRFRIWGKEAVEKSAVSPFKKPYEVP